MAFSVRPVETRKDLETFIKLPYWIYRDDKNWVPPLLREEKKKFSKKNPSLFHCDYQYFLLFQDGKAVGRTVAFVHRQAVEHWKEPVGSFGCYECIDNYEASKLLLDKAREWLKSQHMAIMRGPWDFDTKEYGFVIKGFDLQPMVMAPYNPMYYNAQMEAYGMKKVKDLLAYHLDCREGYNLPERFLKLTDRIAEKYGVKVRSLNMKQLEKDVKIIVDVANESTAPNWGYVPVTDEEAHAIAKSMKPIVDPDIVMIAEVDGKPVGYLIVFPDVNTVTKNLNGRLLPFGFLKLLSGLKKIRQYRVWALGVVPEYQRKAIDTLFYRRLYDVLYPKGPTLVEANYVLEDNMAMSNPILKLGFKEAKRYRVYEVGI